MNIDEYRQIIVPRFGVVKQVQVGDFSAEQFSEEKFELKWLATKLKMFYFLSYQPEITGQDIRAYSAACFEQALKEYKGLPRGMQTGVASIAVLAADQVDKTAADFVMGKAPKHYAAMEFPAIYDLTYSALVYCRKKPMWGAMYYGYLTESAEQYFSPNR